MIELSKIVWNEQSIKQFVLQFSDEYLGHEIKYSHDGKRKRKRIYVQMRCKECESVRDIEISNVKKGVTHCKKCSQQNMVNEFRKNDIKIVKELFEKHGLILLSTEYTSNSIPLAAVNVEGYKVNISYNNLLKGHTPMVFGYQNKFSIDNIKLFIKRHCADYELLSDTFVKADIEKLTFKCGKGHVHEKTWNDFRNGHRCPICNESKGENAIRKYLETKNIRFEREYRFEDCKNNKPLPFDFYLPEQGVCIEYDGIQHYQPNPFFGGESAYNRTVENDGIKTKYCIENNILLIRIPYYVNDVVDCLEERLKI